MNLQKMSIEKKIARLSEKKKAYILGYIDRALRGKSMPMFAKKRGGVSKKISSYEFI